MNYRVTEGFNFDPSTVSLATVTGLGSVYCDLRRCLF